MIFQSNLVEREKKTLIPLRPLFVTAPTRYYLNALWPLIREHLGSSQLTNTPFRRRIHFNPLFDPAQSVEAGTYLGPEYTLTSHSTQSLRSTSTAPLPYSTQPANRLDLESTLTSHSTWHEASTRPPAASRPSALAREVFPSLECLDVTDKRLCLFLIKLYC